VFLKLEKYFYGRIEVPSLRKEGGNRQKKRKKEATSPGVRGGKGRSQPCQKKKNTQRREVLYRGEKD